MANDSAITVMHLVDTIPPPLARGILIKLLYDETFKQLQTAVQERQQRT